MGSALSFIMEAVGEIVITSRPKKNAKILAKVNFSLSKRAKNVYETRLRF